VLGERCTVLDFGGNVGVHYLRLRKYLDLEKVEWIVWDVSEITKVGREVCAGISNIQFINDISEFRGSVPDVLLASDSIQYIRSPQCLVAKLISLGLRPRRILINELPLYDGESFVTLQNGGLVWYPLNVFNRKEFMAMMVMSGYELTDCWSDNSNWCVIPFYSTRSIQAFKGLYFLEM
jgi:putative methyltransferase (TIGR04325 family)